MPEYRIENCSHYKESTEIAGIPIYIFETHNLALPAWGTVSSKLKIPLHLVTFDSHTDTHPAFSGHIFDETDELPEKYGLENSIIQDLLEKAHYKREDFLFEDVWQLAVGCLENTEQILAGMDFGYLSSYTVVNRKDEVHSGFEREDRMMGYNATYISRESWHDWSAEVVQDPLIVNFDLDFFGSSSDFDNAFRQKAVPLLKRAKAITISREQKYFEYCKEDKSYTNEQALRQLLSLTKEAIKRL